MLPDSKEHLGLSPAAWGEADQTPSCHQQGESIHPGRIRIGEFDCVPSTFIDRVPSPGQVLGAYLFNEGMNE